MTRTNLRVRIRVGWVLGAGLLVTVPTRAADTNAFTTLPLATAAMDYVKLAKSGVRIYKESQIKKTAEGRSQLEFAAMQTMGTKITPTGLRFIDKFVYGLRTFEYSLECHRNPSLSLAALRFTISQAGTAVSTGLMRVHGRVGALRVGDKIEELRFPDTTVIEASLRRIVICLPRTPRVVYTFEHFSPTLDIHASAARAGHPYTITCRGAYRIRTQAKTTLICTKYEVEVGDTLSSYYVNEEDVLQRVVTAGSLLDLVD